MPLPIPPVFIFLPLEVPFCAAQTGFSIHYFSGIGNFFFVCAYKVLKNESIASNCSGDSLLDRWIKSICREVRYTAQPSSSRKNCDNEISNALQIFFKDGIEGTIFLRYQEEIVDCVSPEYSAN